MGHARALVTINDPVQQLSIYNLIIKEGLSVRKVESLVRELNDGKSADSKDKKKTNSNSDDFDILKQHLSNYFNTKVQFNCNKSGKGKITIPFSNPEELEHIIAMLDTMKK